MTRITEAAASPRLTRIQRDKNKPAPKVLNRYGFVVDKRANKIEIKKAVESFYGVKVLDVNTMNYSGKVKARYTKAIRERRLGSYSIVFTTAGTPSLSLLKSTKRYNCL